MTDTPPEREAEGTWARLHRRKVVQWTLLYATGAFGLAQGLAHLVETYHWPEPVQQLGTLALILGLPVAVVLAWFHGERGDQRIGRAELVILSVLLALGGGALWWYGSRVEQASPDDAAAQASQRTPPRDAPSVAVLPFVNMSSDPEQEYFSDGLSEEILNALARTPGLYVPARTSSFQFKGQAGDVAQFAAMLGVATVLEGSVRKADGRVRVTAQLINAADGYHLWSQTYDRELKDIFAIQSEIATAITDALRVQLAAGQKMAAAQLPPTANMDAYEEYLLGRFEFNKRRPEAFVSAVSHLEKAIALDPQFADAYADLSIALMMAGKEYLPTSAEEARSRQALDAAVSIAPDRPSVLAAAAYYAWRDARLAGNIRDDNGELKPEARARTERALEKIERALAANPSSVDLMGWRQSALHHLGRPTSSLAYTSEALKLDPLSVAALRRHVWALENRNRRAEALPLIDRLMSLDPPSAHAALAALAGRDGDIAERFRHMLIYYDLANEAEPAVTGELGGMLAFLGYRAEALAAVSRAGDSTRMVWFYWNLGDFRAAAEANRQAVTDDQWAYNCSLGHLLYLTSDFDGADKALDLCWEKGVPMLGVGGMRLVIAADVARRLGHDEKAGRYIRWLERELRLEEADGVVVNDHFLLAMYEAYKGRSDVAAGHLVASVRENYWDEAPHMVLLSGLTDRPDYLEAVKARRAELARQGVEVLEMLCGPEPVSRKYKPLPETCAQWQQTKQQR